jgi:membrane-bound inhibitor of C-type lysozyme
MRVTPSGSGARYTGGNRQLWEVKGVALLTWGKGANEVSCPIQDK